MIRAFIVRVYVIWVIASCALCLCFLSAVRLKKSKRAFGTNILNRLPTLKRSEEIATIQYQR